MIHFIVIMHFAAVTAGVITLLLAWLQYQRRQDQVIKWLFYADLVFTLNMVLDAIRIYLSKNVAGVTPGFWSGFEFTMYLASVVTILAALRLASTTTPKPLPVKPLGLLVIILSAPGAAVFLGGALPFTVDRFTATLIFTIMLLGCIVYGVYSLSRAEVRYRPINITFTAAMALYLLVYSLTGIIPGVPDWVNRIPYSQIIYLSLNALGIVYIVRTSRERVVQVTKQPSLDFLSEQYGLTERELEIATEIYAGRNNPEIAEKLIISANTVKNHVYNIYKKIGIKNRYELIALIAKTHQPH